MKSLSALLCILVANIGYAQLPWPSESWSSATPLTSVMSSSGLLELSGLHWNALRNRLYVVQGDGRLRVLQLDTATNSFTQIGNRSLTGGPEGITQADLAADQFYVIDENNYSIRQYSHLPDFSAVTLTRFWNLLNPPSPMQHTGNTGPEGIAFVPDDRLAAIGFTSSETGQPYTSTMGAGGLFFVAHQDGGYIWVFDLNPAVDNDFVYVGKYATARGESCDLSFDRSTGLLYILHNLGANYLEVTDLTLAPVSITKFNTVAEYFVGNPFDGNSNVEGFAVMPKCDSEVTGSAFLCRDVEADENIAIRLDAIRWFNPYAIDGICPPLQMQEFAQLSVLVYPNPTTEMLTVELNDETSHSLSVYNVIGQVILHENNARGTIRLGTMDWASGVYILKVAGGDQRYTYKFLKK